MDRTLANLKRRLEKAELEHLRGHCAVLADRLEKADERATVAEELADFYWQEHMNLVQSLTDQGEEIGMTRDGHIGVIDKESTAFKVQSPCAINEKWPGTDATYAGISLSSDHSQAVHLLLWPESDSTELDHNDATAVAATVNPETGSHLPTRIQYLTLFQNLREHFDKDACYWTSTKTESGKSAFCQDFNNGSQYYDNLSAECRVRAVSEIPFNSSALYSL
jgi:hypothetical protein